MPKPLRTAVSVAVAALVGTGLAGCSDDDNGSSSPSPTGTGPTVAVRMVGDLGNVLVNADGRTLYLFEPDSPGVSVCTGACAVAWPPLTVDGTPTAGDNADGGKLGTFTRPDGSTGVTYNGHPLYTFVADTRDGASNGQGLDQFGGKWWVVDTDGNAVTSEQIPGRGGGGY